MSEHQKKKNSKNSVKSCAGNNKCCMSGRQEVMVRQLMERDGPEPGCCVYYIKLCFIFSKAMYKHASLFNI